MRHRRFAEEPKGMRDEVGDSGGSNGLRPPYQCLVNGRTVTTNRSRSGFWLVRQNNNNIPMR
ncbi:hypothetical protein [Sinorhizobium medicae]|uniref:hypothetical protein n=1 Tax=Sinorhizobium medicae TaxID=110321 RepID=UPI002AF6B084|nr:hypothetical protein [Sinorhizobium medicae]WQO48709.1 hypothetical protein U8C42_28500 [Sinorhizobium medicae]WQO68867.1 hypothetical protein U8C40_29045 [Sinorhizobium medicae]WQO77638.1 hypothetical protein U8C31_37730 [Sinorhizobium medicae]